MKTQSYIKNIRAARLALCLVGFALSGPLTLLAADAAPTSAHYGSGKAYKTTVERRSQGELTAEDLHQASLLSSQMLLHLNAAATHCVDGKADQAKPEIAKAQALTAIIRSLLPSTTVTTTVKDAQGTEVFRDEQKVQDDQIPIYKGAVAVEVVEPLVEAKKDEAALKGLKLAEADVIHTSVLADLSYIERKLARASHLLDKPEEAATQLTMAQTLGIRMSTHKEDSPLVDVQQALRLAERMVQEKKYDGARANLGLAKLRLEAYRTLVGTAEAKPAADLEKDIERIAAELEKPGVKERIREIWQKTTSWFKREAGQAHDTTTTTGISGDNGERKEATP